MSSDTPRTDSKWHDVAMELPFTLAAYNPIDGLGEIVPADFARQLERALAAKSAEVIALRQALSQILGWRELRDSNAFPIERVEAIARAALQSTERGEHE